MPASPSREADTTGGPPSADTTVSHPVRVMPESRSRFTLGRIKASDRREHHHPAYAARALRGESRNKVSKSKLPWPVRSVLAGTVGTATMTVAYASARRLRPRMHAPLDYDDSLVPGQIVAGLMRLPGATKQQQNQLALALRWSYGPAFGLWHGALRRRIAEPWASTAFGATVMTATLTLFPLLGGTPPPWRWPPSVIATSLSTHAAYVGAVAAVDRRGRPAR